jgi:16S rRNA (guanine527-N7)-methyltransferase
VIRLLNLKNIYAHQYRIEQLSNLPDFAGQFDVVISRAFTSLKKFLELSVPFIKADGVIIAMKGKEVQKELDELTSAETDENIYVINDNKFELQIEKYRLPVSGDERSLVIVRNHF